MFRISNFFVSLPDTFELAHKKKKKELSMALFFFVVLFFFILKGKGNCFIILNKDCTSHSFTENQSCTLLVCTPVNCMLKYCSVVPENITCVIKTQKRPEEGRINLCVFL